MNSFLIPQLTATDEANGKSSSAEVDLTIKNVNDHIPVFDSAPYKANVPENSAVGASVITIHVRYLRYKHVSCN